MNSSYRSHTGTGFGTMVRQPQASKTVYVPMHNKQVEGGSTNGGLGKRVYKAKRGRRKKHSSVKISKKKRRKSNKKRNKKHRKKRSKVINF